MTCFFNSKFITKMFPLMFSLRVFKIYKNRVNVFDKLTLNNFKNRISNDGEKLQISINNKNYIFHGWYLGDLPECFSSDNYNKFNLKNKNVLDVGSNICDSSISFIEQGADKVFCVEPSKTNANFATKNIIENNLQDKITLYNSAISDEEKIILISKGQGLGFIPESNKEGEPLSFHTLEYFINLMPEKPIVLKLDCEGKEYDVLLNSPDRIFKKIETIILEFHNGYKILEKRLNDLGYVTIININYDQKDSKNKGKTGHMIAELVGKKV